MVAWATIVACQLRFYQLAKRGELERPKFRMPFAPYSGYATLAFLVGVLVLMFFDKVQGPWMLGAAGDRHPRPHRRLVPGPRSRASAAAEGTAPGQVGSSTS